MRHVTSQPITTWHVTSQLITTHVSIHMSVAWFFFYPTHLSLVFHLPDWSLIVFFRPPHCFVLRPIHQLILDVHFVLSPAFRMFAPFIIVEVIPQITTMPTLISQSQYDTSLSKKLQRDTSLPNQSQRMYPSICQLPDFIFYLVHLSLSCFFGLHIVLF